jgi:hypothetical protein
MTARQRDIASLAAIAAMVAIAFVMAGPAEQSHEQLCTAYAPRAEACRRF